MKTEEVKWVLCPVCGNKTRTKIREDTELKNFPLYCPKCKKETVISVIGQNVAVVADCHAINQLPKPSISNN